MNGCFETKPNIITQKFPAVTYGYIFVIFQFVRLENTSLCQTILAWIVRVEMMADRLMTVGNGRATIYIVLRVNGRSI